MNEKDINLSVNAVPWCPTQSTINVASRALFEHPLVQERLKGTRYRLLSFQSIDTGDKTNLPVASQHYRATIYDYSHNRTLLADGRLDQPELLEVAESSLQPLPSDEEFEAAMELLLNDSELGPALCERRLLPYCPMPPLIETELADGRIERTLAVGLFAPNEEILHRIVGVNMVREAVIHEVPDVALPSGNRCGAPFGEGCPQSGNAGQVRVTVTQGSTVLWTFTAVRPAASSGTNGSGIELRYVNYRGKRVLYRAHVPILNVEYFQDDINAGCGPTYRDWQNSEACF